MLQLYICILRHKKNIPRDSRDTRPYFHRVQDQPWAFNGPYRAPNINVRIFEKNFGNFEKISGLSIFDIL